MFKKDISPPPKSKVKSSVQRSLRQSLLSTYPLLAPVIDEIMPKKAPLSSMKLPDRATLYVTGSTPLFFQGPDGPTLLPHLRLVHRFPHCFPTVRIDRGAVRFVLSGATLMAPGLTSRGGRLPEPRDPPPQAAKDEPDPTAKGENADDGEGGEDGEEELRQEWGADEEGRWWRDLDKGEPVVVMAEGKEEACAVGILTVGTKEIKEKSKGPAMGDSHYLGDGLWMMSTE